MYATTLDERVRDPLEEKKAAIQARAARTRANLDEYNERSDALRQDWATSPNEILRMGGNALREIVVCAEEDLLMLEDELGRLEGILAPADHDGPAGRVTSGQYGSDVNAGPAGNGGGGRHTLLASQRVPSLPRSPTLPVEPKSASKLGVQGDDASARGDSSEGDPSPALASFALGDRMKNFLLGPTGALRRQPDDTSTTESTNFATITGVDGASGNTGMGARSQSGQKTFSSLFQAPPTPFVKPPQQGYHDADDRKKNSSLTSSTFPDVPIIPAAGSGMGLVEWQRVNGTRAFSVSEDSPSFWDSLNFKPVQVLEPSPASTSTSSAQSSSPYAAAAATFLPHQDAGLVQPVFRRPNRHLAARAYAHAHGMLPPTPEEEPPFLSGGATLLPSQSYGFHVAQPLGRLHPGTDAAHANNVPVPGVGKIPTAKQCVAIKDFQVRVWKSATTTNSSLAEQKDEDKENVAPGAGDAFAARTKEDIAKTREEFKSQIAELAASKATREVGRAQEGVQKRAGNVPVAGEEKDEDFFRRNRTSVVDHRPAPDMDDPFI